MPLFGRKKEKKPAVRFDPARYTPVIRCSICTGEQSAGFRDRNTGRVEEIMLIRDERDLADFRAQYGIEGEIERVY